MIAACALLLLLAGCASQQADAEAQAQAQAANDDARCQASGAAPGTPDYIQCRKNLADKRTQMRAAQRQQTQR
jgi:hypothetical protein